MKRTKFLLMALAISLTPGCQTPISGASGETQKRTVERMPDRGVLALRVLWPDTASRQIQAVPFAARTAVFTVMAASGDVVATRTLKRGGATVAISLDLEPGDDYSVTAELFDENAELLASGKSLPFRILRQRTSTVELTLEPIISRIVGTGSSGYTGDGLPASEAKIWAPLGLAADREGNLLFADSINHVIRKVDAGGNISTVAGTGKASATGPNPVPPLILGDNGPVAEVTLNRPSAVAVSANGDLFIADTWNRGIRMLPATSGERYGQTLVAEHLHTIHYDGTPADRVPHSLAVDLEGNVYFAETARIRRLTPAGQLESVAGTGTAAVEIAGNGPALEVPLNVPDGLMLDPSGNLLFTEQKAHRVRMLCRVPGTYFGIPMASGSVYAIAGKGVATTDLLSLGDGKDGLEATFNGPRGLARDGRGNLYISDINNQRIRRLTPDRQISTIAGSGIKSAIAATNVGDGGSALLATFWNPVGLAIHGEMLFVADSNNHRVRRVPI